eukprot:TRINITY_DN11109_c0_g1_i1.p1 TRINITY_DN11109_c0_g1~~TRINITY_DN11109_c0_g1_i1.p1  ORF type:complete len:327 (-),score=50.78 TRINITY_DN11109_c0_g1_i1:83-1036(-)
MSGCINLLLAVPRLLSCYCSRATVFHINGKTYRAKKLLGEGGYAKVWLVEESTTKQLFALKSCLTADVDKQKETSKEIQMLKSFIHPNIIKLHDSAIIPSKLDGAEEIHMLLDYCPKGSLQGLINRMIKEKFFLTESEMMKIFIPICEAVSVLHSHNPPMAHRDIKPDNILFDKYNAPVLIDFGSMGLAKVQVSSVQESMILQEDATAFSTPAYRAPELYDLDPDNVIDERVDVWALGCTLYAMAFHSNPFDDAVLRGGNIKMAVINGKYSFPKAHGYSVAFCDLIKYMLNTNSSQRPNIKNVLKRADKVLRSGLAT